MNVEEIIKFIRSTKEEITQLVSNITLVNIEDCINKSLNPIEAPKAIASTLLELSKVEQVNYDISIAKMEIRNLLETLGNLDSLTALKKEAKTALIVLGDCHQIIKSRYDFLGIVFGGIRSLNSNFRSLKSNDIPLGDPRAEK